MGKYEDTLIRLGFAKDPFQYQFGEKMSEELLEETWVIFPGAERILDLEQSSVLLAKPGSGKTTWRRYVEKTISRESDGKYLVVVYNRFQIPANSMVTLNDHRDPLLGHIARTVFDLLTRDNQTLQNNAPSILVHIQPNWQNWWYAFLTYYLPDHYRNNLNDLFISDSKLSIDLPKWHTIEDLREILLDELLPALASLGITRLYVLLDDLDGLLEAQDQAILSSLVEPLINTNPLLSDNRLIWKFFIPASIENIIRQSSGYKTGRLEMLSIEWDHNSLANLLELLLNYASEGIIKSIDQLVAADVLQALPNVTDELCKMALEAKQLGPPRQLLRLGQLLFEQISEAVITKDDWSSFLTIASREDSPRLHIVYVERDKDLANQIITDLDNDRSNIYLLKRQEVVNQKQVQQILESMKENERLIFIFTPRLTQLNIGSLKETWIGHLPQIIPLLMNNSLIPQPLNDNMLDFRSYGVNALRLLKLLLLGHSPGNRHLTELLRLEIAIQRLLYFCYDISGITKMSLQQEANTLLTNLRLVENSPPETNKRLLWNEQEEKIKQINDFIYRHIDTTKRLEDFMPSTLRE